MMKILKLTKGYYAQVDDSDFEALSKHKWTALVTGTKIKRVYAYRRTDWDNVKRRYAFRALFICIAKLCLPSRYGH